MNIQLVDADSTIPNLALMRLSAFHRGRGDSVSLNRLHISYYPHKRRREYHIATAGFDKTYCSIIFDGALGLIKADGDVEYGGSGFDIQKALPPEVDALDPDYSIYPENDTSYGFISRGCNRKCYFCIVPQKEGRTHQVSNIDRIVKHKLVKFLDNNFLQLPNHKDLLRELIAKNIRFQFNQGLDFRLIDAENSDLLRQANWHKEYLFAFDDWKYRKSVERQLSLLAWRKPWAFKFYIYVAPHMPVLDTIERVLWLRSRQLLPYVMRDRAVWGSPFEKFYTDFAAWANQPGFIKKMSFFEFLDRRRAAGDIDEVRRDDNKRIYDEALNAEELAG